MKENFLIVKKDNQIKVFDAQTDELLLKLNINNEEEKDRLNITITKKTISKEKEKEIIEEIEKKYNYKIKKINNIEQSKKIIISSMLTEKELKKAKTLFNKYITITYKNPDNPLKIQNMNTIYANFYQMYVDTTITKLLNNAAFEKSIGFRKSDYKFLYEDEDIIIKRNHIKNGNFIISLDINNLKQMNDNYSHLYGDIMLKVFGEYLENNFNTLNFRTGGDEFFCISKTLKETIELKEKLNSEDFNKYMLENMNKELSYIGFPEVNKNFIFGVSMGFIEYYDKNGYGLKQYKEIADKYMYVEKANKHIQKGVFNRNSKEYSSGFGKLIIKETLYDLIPIDYLKDIITKMESDYFNDKSKFEKNLKIIKNIENDATLLEKKLEELEKIQKKYNYEILYKDLKYNNPELFNKYISEYKKIFKNIENQNGYVFLNNIYDNTMKFFYTKKRLIDLININKNKITNSKNSIEERLKECISINYFDCIVDCLKEIDKSKFIDNLYINYVEAYKTLIKITDNRIKSKEIIEMIIEEDKKNVEISKSKIKELVFIKEFENKEDEFYNYINSNPLKELKIKNKKMDLRDIF